MKHLTIILFGIFLSACATNDPPEISASGDGIMVVMASEDYARLKAAEADAAAATAYYAAQAKRYESVTDPTAQLGMRAIDALDPTNKAPTNQNDVLIAEAEQQTARTGIRWSTADSMLGKGLIFGGIREARKLGEAAFNSAGDRITTNTTNNADNGSTVKGAIGQGNSYAETEQVSGILTEPAPVNPITLSKDGTETVDDFVCVDIRELVDGDPAGTDGNGDGFVCSDGAGGVADNN